MKKFALIYLLILSALPQNVLADEVNVYSARKEALIRPLLERFTKTTGIIVNLVTGKADALLSRLQNESRNSPADLFITVDVGRLSRAKNAGVLQPVSDPGLEQLVPTRYRDRGNYWFGLSMRARTIVYSRERVKKTSLSSYQQLADPVWRKRLCLRSSENIYNQSLVAAMIVSDGEAATLQWAKGMVRNLARSPRGGDRDQIKAVAAGLCDVTLINTYYLGRMIKSKRQDARAVAAKVAIFWPNQQGRGVHVNISGAGVTVSAPHRENAIRLLKFLLTAESQRWYAKVNYEYPVRAGIAVDPLVAGWGEFKRDDGPLPQLGDFNARAVMLMDDAGWK
ncbi:MAG TPA: Fe(3+) ABC transporter substrate-binding protein [Gammaproteobacteria bacterium]|nr:Fe(3+) ABC transporter substrate-binding protein [Gammaproteobacteria bacterium]